jgi:hypothetical protein
MKNKYTLSTKLRLNLQYLIPKSISILFFMVFVFGLNTSLKAAVSGYTAVRTTVAYVAISGGTNLCTNAATCNDVAFAAVTLPWNFNFNGTLYSQIYVSDNGFITFGAAAAGTVYTPISTTMAGVTGAISVFGRNNNVSGAGRTIRYKNNGTSFSIEWVRAGTGSNLAGTQLDAQITLFQTTNVIEFTYRAPGSYPVNSGTPSNQVGLVGSTTADFKNLTSLTAAPGYGGVNTATASYSSANYTTVNNTKFTWTPPAFCTAPTTLASLGLGTNITNVQTDISFTRGNGTGGVLVVARTNATTAVAPASGTTYGSPSTVFGSGTPTTGTGNFPVYNGTGNGTGAVTTPITISNLTPGTTYAFDMYEYNTTGTCYTAAYTFTVAIPLCLPPTTQATLPSTSAITANSATLSWTSGNGTAGDFVILNQNTAVASDPTQNTSYTANAAFGLGSLIGTGRAVYAGNAGSVNITGLAVNTTYHYAIYTYNSAGPCYKTPALIGSFTTADGPMTYAASTVTQSSVASVTLAAANQQIVQIQLNTGAGTSPALSLTSLTFNTNGSTLGATVGNDISSARIFYNTTNTLAGAVQFGSDVNIFPGGSTPIVVAGSQILQPNSNNYFFIVYDVSIGATTGNVLDGEITSLTYTDGVTPVTTAPSPTTAPVGSRTINSLMSVTCGYTYSNFTPTWTSNVGQPGTTVVASGAASIDDQRWPSQSFAPGFTFEYNGTVYNSIGIHSKGYVWFGTTNPSGLTSTPISSALGYDGAIAAFAFDMVAHSSSSTTPQVSVRYTGTAPNRVCIIEWTAFRPFGNTGGLCPAFGSPNDWNRYDIQLQLNENGGTNSNRIDIILRDMNPFCVNANGANAQVGLRGSSNADFLNRTGTGNNAHTASSAGTLNTSVITHGANNYFNGNGGLRFTPTFAIPTITPSPTVSNVCPATDVALSTTSPVLLKQWFNNNLPISGATAASYSAVASGNHMLMVTIGACSKLSNITAVTITPCGTNTISTNDVAVTNCAGAAISVSFNAVGTYTAGNVYTAQLSDAGGSFASPVTIGTLSSTANGALTINAGPGIIPGATPAGVGYKIRVISSNPSITGTENTPFEVLDPAPIISVTNPAAGCAPGTVDITASGVVTVTNGTSISSITYWTNAGATLAFGGNPNAVNNTDPSPIYVKYTNACGSDIEPIAVTFNNPVIGTNSKTNPTTCAGNNGTITLNGLLPSTSYNVVYQKNGPPNVNAGAILTNGSGSLTITGLGDGAYDNIVVTLAGCASTPAYPTSGFIQLNDPSAPVVSGYSSVNPTTCSTADGSITLTGLLASTAYNVTYDKNASTVNAGSLTTDGSGNLIIPNLGDGYYDNIYVTLSGCNSLPVPSSGVIALIPPASPVISSATPTNPTTCAGANGIIQLGGLAASTAYTVTYIKGITPVNGGSISTDGSGVLAVNGLTQGAYSSFVVTNALTCFSNSYPSSGSITLTDPPQPTISSFTANDPITCSGNDGNIQLGGLLVSTTYTVTYKKNGGSTINAGSLISNGSGVLTIPNLGSGDYDNIIVTINNCASDPYPVSGNISLVEPPIPGFATGIPAEVCGADVLLLSASGAGAGEDYKWYSTATGPSLEQTGGSTFGTPLISTTTNYYVTIFNTTSGCESPTRTLVVATIFANPVATISGSLNSCGSSLLSSASSTAGSGIISNRQWKESGVNIPLENGISYLAVANGNYSVEITNSNGCTTTSAVSSVTIAPQPTAVAGGSVSTCENGSVTVSGASASNGTILWTHNGTGNLTNETTLTPTYTCAAADAGNTVTLTMTVTPTLPCLPITATYTIDVRPRPVVTPASVNLTCGGSPFQQLDIVAPEANTDYKWTPASDLYLDNAFNVPYVLGTSATTLFAAPFTNITYSVTATNTITGCTTGATNVSVVVCTNLTDAICNADGAAGLVSVTTTPTFYLYDFSGSTFGGGASCASSLDKDIWRRAIVPANGEINVVTKLHNDPIANLNITSASAQIFTAANCSTAVVSVACDAGGAAGNMAYTHASGLTPGSTVYIRIGRLSAPANNPIVSRYIKVAVTSGLVWTAAVDDDFNNPANWHGGDASALTKPDASISAIVPSTVTKPKLYINSTARGMNFTTGAPYFVSQGINLNGFTLNVKGDWTVGPSAASSLVLDCNGTVEFNGNAAMAQTIGGGKTTFGNLTTNNTVAGVTLTNTTGVACIINTPAGNLNSAGFLVLRSTTTTAALVNPLAGTITGNVSVERKIGTMSGYHYLSSPVSGAFVNNTVNGWRDDFTILSSLDGIVFIPGNTYSTLPSVWEYNETNLNPNPAYGWISATAGDDVITPLKGFACVITANTVVDVLGTLNNGTIAGGYNITKTIGTGVGEGLNAIGNPYPSPISWNAFRALPSNSGLLSTSGYQAFISSGGYNGSYGSWDGAVGSPASVTDKITSSQGVMVTALAAGAINAANSARLTSAADVNATFFNGYNNVPDLMRIEIQGNGFANESAIYFDGTGNDAFDMHRDARKINTTAAGVPNIYTYIDNNPLNINVMGTLNMDKVVPLGVKIQTAGTYNLIATDMTNFAPSVIAYLEDTQAGTMTNLRTHPSYLVALPVGEINNRFFIHFRPAVALNTVNETCAGNDGKLIINYPTTNTVDMVIKDENGNVVSTQSNLTGTVTINHLAAGNYVAEMSFGEAPNTYTTLDYFTIAEGNAVYASISASATAVDMNTNTTINFTATSQGSTHFNWSFGDGSVLENGPANVAHTYTQVGTYIVTFEASNGICNAVATTSIEVTNATGLTSIAHSKLQVIGIGSKVTVRFGNNMEGTGKIEVLNMLGEVVAHLDNVSMKGTKEMELSNLAAGQYLIKITNNNKLYTEKVFLSRQ